jgi:N-acetylglucosaminyl-diphospho-decaprenol L-rhamnosyltransferase
VPARGPGGLATAYVRASEVAHIGSVSTGMKSWSRMPGYWFDSRMHYFVKNHGRAYAAAATAAHLAGGLIWRARRLIQRRPPADPPHFLRDMALHALRGALPGRRAGARHSDQHATGSDRRVGRDPLGESR